MVRLTPRGLSARMCVLPASALPLAVAVFAPVAPATACGTRLPSIDMPVALLAPLARSKDSAIPEGGDHVPADARPCEVTTMVLARVVVTLGVACVVADGVV